MKIACRTYWILGLILMLVTFSHVRYLILGFSQTLFDLYLCAAAAGIGISMVLFGITVFIAGWVKKHKPIALVARLLSIPLFGFMGVANYLMFWLVLGFTGT